MLSHSCEKCSFNHRELCLYVSVTKILRGKVSMDASNGLDVKVSRCSEHFQQPITQNSNARGCQGKVKMSIQLLLNPWVKRLKITKAARWNITRSSPTPKISHMATVKIKRWHDLTIMVVLGFNLYRFHTITYWSHWGDCWSVLGTANHC